MSGRAAPEIDRLYTIGEGGRRNFLHPAEARGRWTRWRRRVGLALMALLTLLPFVTINDAPGIWLDVTHRRFFILGARLGPSDSYLLFFLLTGIGFTLVVASALWGRIWCGFACPQTVFLEGLYRPIERLFEGSRDKQLKLERAPWTAAKALRKIGKHAAFLSVSALLAHLFLCYFVGARELWALMRMGPLAEPSVFVWALALTGLMYGNFAWFREQLCIIMCPYGRLQSALSDADTRVVLYDERRGEPRGKSAAGDCVDCGRCIAVCPTGIDIRQGLQLECIGCAACIDACDDVMEKTKRPLGLIRYDSIAGLGGHRRIFRPRLLVYAALCAAGIIAAALTASAHRPFALTLSRQAGPPFVRDGASVRNTFVLKAENTTDTAATLELSAHLPPHAQLLVGGGSIVLPARAVSRFPLVLSSPAASGAFDFSIALAHAGDDPTEIHARFIAP